MIPIDSTGGPVGPFIADLGVSRRTLIKTGGMAAVGALAIGSAGCDKKDVDFYVATLTGAFEELKPLLPAQSALLAKAISIAKSFNDAYQGGKFDTATKLFENLVSVVGDLIAAAGVNVSGSVKIALAVAGVATRAIAVLMKQAADDNPQVAAAVNKESTMSKEASARASLIERLADMTTVNSVLEAAKP